MSDIGWGSLEKAASYGLPFDSTTDFSVIDYEEAVGKYKEFMHASHGMIFTRLDDLLWERFPRRGAVLMQLRFDGNIGFPGGLVDKGDETTVEALNREMKEEIELDLDNFSFSQDQHIISHIHHNKQLVTHFYCMEVTASQYKDIECNVLLAKDWGVETSGIIRVPMSVLGDGFRGLPVFLSNKFAGNAKEQLLYSIRKTNLIPDEELSVILKAHEEYEKTVNRNSTHRTESEIPRTDIPMEHFATSYNSDYTQIDKDTVHLYESYTQAAHAMIYAKQENSLSVMIQLRFDGYFGFPGGLGEPGETIQVSLNRELKEELGWSPEQEISKEHHCMSHLNEKTKLCLHFYCYPVHSECYKQVEDSQMQALEWGKEVLGLIRVPLKHLDNFLQNVFIGNTKDQLEHALKTICS